MGAEQGRKSRARTPPWGICVRRPVSELACFCKKFSLLQASHFWALWLHAPSCYTGAKSPGP